MDIKKDILNPKVSVIIVSFNIKEYLKNCLISLKEESQNLPIEVIVVDNSSSDGTIEMLKIEHKNWQALKLIVNKENQGFAKACNQGSQIGKGIYFLFLNPDTIVKKFSILGLMSYLDMHQEVGVVGSKIFYPDGSLQFSCGNILNLKYAIFEAFRLWTISLKLFGSYRYMTWDHNDQKDVGWVSGACLVIRSKLFKQIGGFDENFFLYAEDADLCLRVKQQGYNIIYLPGIEFIHFEGKSSKKIRQYALLKGYQSKLYYFKKNKGLTQCIILRIVFAISSLLKSVLAGILIIAYRNLKYFEILKSHLVVILKVFFITLPKPSRK